MPRAFAGRTALLALLPLAASAQVTDLHNRPADPLSDRRKVHVLLFVRTDCPITNRYAPELHRIADHFSRAAVDFSLVYSGGAVRRAAVEEQVQQYNFPGTPLLDPHSELMGRAQATVSPEAAVFDRQSRLIYLGRIDDRWISFGKSRPEPTTHDLESAISAVLAGKAPAEQRTRAIGCSLDDVQ